MNDTTEPDAWAEEVLGILRRHQRRDIAGLWSLLNTGMFDVFDLLAVVPALPALRDDTERQARAEIVARERQRRLDAYRVDWTQIRREEEEAGE